MEETIFIDLEEKSEKTEAEQVISEYYEIDSEIKKLEKRKKDLAEQLKDNKAGTYQIGDYIADVTEIPGRSTLDKNKIKDFLESSGQYISDFEKEGKGYKKLSVKRLV